MLLVEEVGLTDAAFKSRNYTSLAALIVTVIDYLLAVKFEYTSIWVPPYRIIKLLYVCSRYLSLITQIVHYTLIHTHLANAPVSASMCQVWIFGLLGSTISLLMILDAVLLLRIYALYQKHKGTLWLLIPIAAQPPALIITCCRSLLGEGRLNGVCEYEGSVVYALSTSITILFAHALLWVATFMRRNIAQGHAVVVKLAVSESALALALIFAALCAIVPYTALKHRVCPFFVIPWLVTVIPMLCCRLIMSMRRLKVETIRQNNEADRYVLSTVVLEPSSNTISDLQCAPPPDKVSKCSSDDSF
ncbi:hypothetical protein BJ165DRAFT_1492444 [Panaeolus papilionaceus]|nr:hypothetical protein BJ165DRAFT_1492444 [Panaeolus papilionaceus]